jgi:hypothetical protein
VYSEGLVTQRCARHLDQVRVAGVFIEGLATRSG